VQQTRVHSCPCLPTKRHNISGIRELEAGFCRLSLFFLQHISHIRSHGYTDTLPTCEVHDDLPGCTLTHRAHRTRCTGGGNSPVIILVWFSCDRRIRPVSRLHKPADQNRSTGEDTRRWRKEGGEVIRVVKPTLSSPALFWGVAPAVEILPGTKLLPVSAFEVNEAVIWIGF
jgi:hypothetical protein